MTGSNLAAGDGSVLWLAVGWTMLHFLWAGSALGLLAAAGLLLLRAARAEARYLFGLVSLALLAVSPAVIFACLVQSPAALRPLAETSSPARLPQVPRVIGAPHDASGPRSAAPGGRAHGGAQTRAALAGRHLLERLARLLPWVWVLGTPVTFAALAMGLLGAERLRRRSRPLLAGDAAQLCGRLARSLAISRPVRLALCEPLGSPVLIGLVRPVILLPPALLSRLTPEQVEMVLLHELAHVRRWDNLLHLGQRLVESALFFHPAVWLVSSWVRLEREHCCDGVVVERTSKPREYAALLAALAEKPALERGTAAALGEGGIVPRLRRILGLQTCPMRHSRALLGLLALLLVSSVFLVGLAGEGDRLAGSGGEFYRFVGEGGVEGRLETAVKTFRNRDGVEVSVITVATAAEKEYFVALRRDLGDHETVLHAGIERHRARSPDGENETSPGGRAAGPLRWLIRTARAVEDHLVTGVFGLAWQPDLGLEGERFVRADLDADTYDRLVAPEARREIQEIEETAVILWRYAQDRLRARERDAQGRDESPRERRASVQSDPEALRFLVAREMALLWSSALRTIDSFVRTNSAYGEYVRTRAEAVFAELRRQLARGKRRLALLYPPHLLPELVRQLERHGFVLAGTRWRTAWDVGG